MVRDRPRRPDPGFADLYATLPDAVELEPWLSWCRDAEPAVLYLGPGAGRLAVPLSQAGVRMVGLDAHPGMLRLLRARLPDLPTVRALAENPPFGAVFALVIGPSGILGRPGCLRAAAGLLRPGGRVGLELINPHWLAAQRRPDLAVKWQTRELVRLEIDYAGGFRQVAMGRLTWPENIESRLRRAGLRLDSMGGSGDSLAGSPTYWALASKRLRRAQIPST